MAAAFKCDAAVIVTENLKDFRTETLMRSNLEGVSLDDFIADAIDLDQERAIASLKRMRIRLRRPEIDAASLVEKVRASGLQQSASIIAGNLDGL